MATRNTTEESKQVDLSKFSVQDLLKLAEEAQALAATNSQKEFDSTMTFLADKLKSMGRSKMEAVQALIELMAEEERKDFYSKMRGAFKISEEYKKPRAPRGSKPAKETADKDKTGARPEPGKTYTINGTEWTKAANGKGRAKDIFIDAIKGGATWAEMLKQ